QTDVETYWHEIIRRVEAIPGVQAVGAAEQLPLTGEMGCTSVGTSGALNTTERGACVPTTIVTPGYFAAMKIPVNGTEASWSETEARHGPVVVSKAYADRFWPNENPIGRGASISGRPPYLSVIG